MLGVVKLFNAVRAAQIKGEEASRQVKQKGVVGMGAREEKGRSPNLPSLYIEPN